MSVSEAQRFEMHTQLRHVMGEEVADTMMEYMPPFGWSDVARKSDLDQLDKRIDRLFHGLWALGAMTASGFIGMFTLIITKL